MYAFCTAGYYQTLEKPYPRKLTADITSRDNYIVVGSLNDLRPQAIRKTLCIMTVTENISKYQVKCSSLLTSAKDVIRLRVLRSSFGQLSGQEIPLSMAFSISRKLGMRSVPQHL